MKARHVFSALGGAALDERARKKTEVICVTGQSTIELDKESISISDYEMRRMRFAFAKTWDEAIYQVWGGEFDVHPYYQHYTTLSTLIHRILQGEWWATRSDSVGLNDVQESKKFGSRELLRRTYQISFSHGTAESAAMWALYSQQDPFAVRILLPKEALQKWIASIELKPGKETQSISLVKEDPIEKPMLRDLIYAAVPHFNAERDALDKDRGGVVHWAEMTCDFRKDKVEKAKLVGYLQTKEVTGWVKDYEWRHERESRVCVRLTKASKRKAIPLLLPPSVIQSMSFSLSPWLTKNQEKVVRSIIKDSLAINCDLLNGALVRSEFVDPTKVEKKFKVRANAFHRSTIEGALNFKKEY